MNVSLLLKILALVLFVLDALITGNVISASGMGWLIAGGLAAWVLSELVP